MQVPPLLPKMGTGSELSSLRRWPRPPRAPFALRGPSQGHRRRVLRLRKCARNHGPNRDRCQSRSGSLRRAESRPRHRPCPVRLPQGLRLSGYGRCRYSGLLRSRAPFRSGPIRRASTGNREAIRSRAAARAGHLILTAVSPAEWASPTSSVSRTSWVSRVSSVSRASLPAILAVRPVCSLAAMRSRSRAVRQISSRVSSRDVRGLPSSPVSAARQVASREVVGHFPRQGWFRAAGRLTRS